MNKGFFDLDRVLIAINKEKTMKCCDCERDFPEEEFALITMKGEPYRVKRCTECREKYLNKKETKKAKYQPMNKNKGMGMKPYSNKPNNYCNYCERKLPSEMFEKINEQGKLVYTKMCIDCRAKKNEYNKNRLNKLSNDIEYSIYKKGELFFVYSEKDGKQIKQEGSYTKLDLAKSMVDKLRNKIEKINY